MKPREYDYIKICLGYPKERDEGRIIWRKWNGVATGKWETDLFGFIECYAIDLGVNVYENQHLAPTQWGKKVLTLNLKSKYWHQIKDYEKNWEYREIKPYWTKRLFK